jgi:hypothetical protein
MPHAFSLRKAMMAARRDSGTQKQGPGLRLTTAIAAPTHLKPLSVRGLEYFSPVTGQKCFT